MRRPQPGDHVYVTTSRYRGREAVLLSWGVGGMATVTILPTPRSKSRTITVKAIIPKDPTLRGTGEDPEDDPVAEMAQLLNVNTARGTAWRRDATCADGLTDPEVFFPEKGKYDTAAEAKMVCAICPVRPECLREALITNPHGIWGGTTEKERIAIKKRRNYHAVKYHCFDPDCDSEFTSAARAGEHYSKAHMLNGQPPPAKVPCRYCDRVFSHRGARARHETTKHPEQVKQSQEAS